MAALLRAILEWLGSFIKGEIKQDVKATDGEVDRGPDVRGKVYFQRDGEWILSKNKVTLPEGWYAVGLPEEED